MCWLSLVNHVFGAPCRTTVSLRACLHQPMSCGSVFPTYALAMCRERGGTDCGVNFPNCGPCLWIVAIRLDRRCRGSSSGPNPRPCGACSVCATSCTPTLMLQLYTQPAHSRTSYPSRQVLCVAWYQTRRILYPAFPTSAASFIGTIRALTSIRWHAPTSSARRSHPFRLSYSPRRCPRVVDCRSPQVRRPPCSGTQAASLPLSPCLRARLHLRPELGPR